MKDYKIFFTEKYNWRCDIYKEADFDRYCIFSASGNTPEEALSNAINQKNEIKD